MKRIVLAVATLTMLISSGDAVCQEGEKTPETPPVDQTTAKESSEMWMRMKLKYGQNIYTSIARADIDAIGLDAKRLRALNWFEGVAHGKDAAYQEQLRVFELANDKLIAEAERKNLDGCTLAFMQMTFSCTACHQRLREVSPHKKPTPAMAPR